MQGSLVRMDGTLKGVNNAKDASSTPGFKRGHFSIVYDGTGEGCCFAKLYFV